MLATHSSKSIRVALVDDHPLFREGLAVALRRESGFVVVGSIGSAVEAIELAKRVVFDIAVVDLLMPNVSGLSLTSELYEIQPRCRVLCLSVVDEVGIIADMMRARACGYALKTQPIAEIVGAISAVHEGVRYLPPRVSRDAVEAHQPGEQVLGRLTRRERQVFELLIRGLSNDEISAQLFIARRTVETHRQRIVNKLSAHSIVQLQRLAARHGALEP